MFSNNNEQAESLRFSDVLIDIPKRSVSIKDKHIDLTQKEFDILCFFATNQGKVFSKEQIYKHVWGSDYAIDDGNITVMLYNKNWHSILKVFDIVIINTRIGENLYGTKSKII